MENTGELASVANFNGLLKQVWVKYVTPESSLQGFMKSGIYIQLIQKDLLQVEKWKRAKRFFQVLHVQMRVMKLPQLMMLPISSRNQVQLQRLNPQNQFLHKSRTQRNGRQ
ncbi:hypothetical protein ElyMa_006477600 [Elysia marginata]|uniref:Uncharacterized protein n=1 Tax=Elysia marginata TaxID=1093978 RepID=A0AAV4HZS3_9GAST|nr:hypothetical protein ElyMa_006477600 [Elysia marginata]